MLQRLPAIEVAMLLGVTAPLYAADEFVGLGTLGGSYSQANAVSAAGGVVVGYAPLVGDATYHAFRWANGSMIDLGTLGGSYSDAKAISAEGGVVAGYAYLAGDATYHAFRWANGSMVDLGTLGGSYSAANAVSADGGVVVGYSFMAGDATYHAFRWSSDDMVDLGTLGGTYSYANAVSADGAVVAGYCGIIGDNAAHAFRWASGSMTDLGTLGGTNSYASALSANGAVVVGYSQITGDAADHAFQWADGSMVDLGTLGGTNSYANAVSADGTVVVGQSQIADNAAEHAFRWTGGGMADLGTLGGSNSYAHAVSANGNVVVGVSQMSDVADWDSFRWTDINGMQSVVDWLAGEGVSLPAGWRLYNGASTVATNQDGSVVVGTGIDPNGNSQAWLARAGGILLDIPAFNATVHEAGSQGVQNGVVVTNLALYGSHHRTLLDSGLVRRQNGACAWATADAARYNSTDTRIGLIEAGVCKDFSTARIGAGVGQTWSRQTWSLGGGAKYDGQYLVVEAANAFDNGMEGSVLGYYARFNTDLRRNYMNGAAVDSSTATPQATSTALRLRLDWKNLAKLANFSFSPYLAYTRAETRLDAYTETGGGFPALYDATTTRSTDLRLGLSAKRTFFYTTDVNLSLEAAHRFEHNVGAVNGEIIGLGSFSVSGQAVKQDWVRAILDVDHRLTDKSALVMSIKSATAGKDASWGISLGYRVAF